MVEVRKAKGDTLEFHKVTMRLAKIKPIKKQMYSCTTVQKLNNLINPYPSACPVTRNLDSLSYWNSLFVCLLFQHLLFEQYVLKCVSCNSLQFYKNLSKTLKDVVWKSDDT
jgi:hypothetical protein